LNKKDLMLCSLLGVLCLILFKDTILGGHYLLGNDFVTFYMGMKQFLYDQVHKYHSIPFWNPYIFGGIPFWAHFESTIFYPLDALFWVISPEKAYGYTVFVHLVLSGIFMYLLTRSLRLSPAGSFIAASVFTFNGFIMGTLHDGQMFRIQAYTWIPLIIFFLNKALTSKSPYFYSTMAGMIWGLQILSGSPQDALYTLIAAFLFLGYHLKPHVREIASSRKILAFASILFLIGLGVAAIQIVPASEFVKESARAEMDSYSLVTIGSYPPQGIVTMAMPNFFGNYVSGNYWVSGIPWTIPLYNLYVGVLPIILFFFISSLIRKQNPQSWSSLGQVLGLQPLFSPSAPTRQSISWRIISRDLIKSEPHQRLLSFGFLPSACWRGKGWTTSLTNHELFIGTGLICISALLFFL